MNLCLTTLYTPNYNGFAPIAIKSFEKFCERYDSDIRVFDNVINKNWHPAWNKLFAIKECFKTHEYVLWCDIDSLYLDIDFDFYQINNLFHKDFVINTDGNGICTSHWLLRNSEYNNKLIDTLLFLGDVVDNNRFNNPDPKWEQNALRGLKDHFDIPMDYFLHKTVIEHDADRLEFNTAFVHYFCMSLEERVFKMKQMFDHFYN